MSKLPIATIKMTDGREIKLALYPAKAPITVANFIDLANNQKFYDNVSEKRHIIFHRIAPGFMIQAGDITASGAGQSGFAIKGEFKENNVETNDISFVPGVIGMARSGSYDSASTQFFITVGTPTHLDGQYAAFGRVISGMDVVQAIANIPTGHNPNIPGDKDYEFPLEEQRIASIRVDTKGVDFTAPPRLNVPIA
ncbi:MAG: peptidylprolyl isomerase [Oscillospiraceae bacterium]|nr:peptidylprolyl isomerase [Oscillospiraceae bacterium]